MECDQMDIVSAFLKSMIDKDIYVSPPEGSSVPAGFILKLRKSSVIEGRTEI